MRNHKENKENFKISVRLYDEKFNVIFGLTKENYKVGIREIDKILRLKLDEEIEKILKK
jgi:hypothetical protein